MSKAIVFLADGLEECEGLITVDILRRAGVETVMASIMGRLEVVSARNITIKADVLAEDADYDSADLVILPGGKIGTENLGNCALVTEKCKEFAKDKHVAAICAAPSVLAGLGLLEGKRATCHPGFEGKMEGAVLTGESAVVDGNIITGQGLGAAFDFALALAKIFAGEETAEQVRSSICYR
ncbi:MAG: DJ-1/PfpI family protein [Lachnospiraceae bacterium]|nr:DJ-1/PfpI family protein [Lachnospiraceae bacterium]